MSGSVAIIGFGGRGKRWASSFHSAGWALRGFDPDTTAGLHLPAQAWRREETISQTVAAAHVVAMCLPERLELMQKVMQRVQAEAPQDAILAVDSAVFSIDDIQNCALRPANVVRAQIADDDGFTIDVSPKTATKIRAASERILSQIAAHNSLAASLSQPQRPDAESA